MSNLRPPPTAAPSVPPPADATPADLALLQTARARRGPIRALADRAGIPPSSVHHMVTTGRGLRAARSWYRLLRLLGIDPDAVLDDNGAGGGAE